MQSQSQPKMRIVNPSPSYCVVLGCKNTAVKLHTWKRTLCSSEPEHKMQQKGKCGCPLPFMLFPFPKSDKLRTMWLYRIGLPDLEVTDSTRVCSKHFLQGRPTSTSYFPTLYLNIGDDEDEDEMDSEQWSEDEDSMDEETCNSKETMKMPIIKNTFHIQQIPEKKTSKISQLPSQPVSRNIENGSGGTNTDNKDVEVVYQAPKTLPLAQYDPSAQTLQIADPAKYIMICHTRIALLTQENEKLKSDKSECNQDIEKLKAENRLLKQRLLKLTSEKAQRNVQVKVNSNGTQLRSSPIVRSPPKFLKLPFRSSSNNSK